MEHKISQQELDHPRRTPHDPGHQTEEGLGNSSTCKENRVRRNIHDPEGRDVLDHVPEDHAHCGDHEGDTEQIEVARWPKTINGMHTHQQKVEPAIGNNGYEGKSTLSDEHVMINRDAESHAIANHDVSQHRRREPEQFEPKVGKEREEKQTKQQEYPWMAPRVVLQYMNWDMGDDKPEPGAIDNYDGEESWRECGREPDDEYREDRKGSANQYHKLAHELYQWGVATDEPILKGFGRR